MDDSDILQAAREVIGENKPADYILDPEGHYEQFQKNAPELAKILKASDVGAVAKEYKLQDSLANEAQREFKKWSRRAHWAFFLTTCLTTGLVTAPAWSTTSVPWHPEYIVALLALGSVICGAFAGASLHQIRSGRLLTKWMEQRARAETMRIQYFNLVVRERPEAKTSSNLPLLQLEYFNRFQLDVQLSFYRVRGEYHRRAAANALILSMWLMFGIALVNGMAGVFGWLDVKWAAVAGFALVGQAFVFKVTNTEAVNQDSRNSERYGRTRSILAMLAGELDSVRQRILEGDRKVLPIFVESVHEQLSLEHRQWLSAFDDRLSALGRFEQHMAELKQYKSDLGEGG